MNADDSVPTPSQTVGPFFHFELTTDEHSVRCIAGPQAEGERIWITFRVLDGDGAPLNDAMLEIWQADANGIYNHPDDPRSKENGAKDVARADSAQKWLGFGRLATSEDGSCELETIKPGKVAGPPSQGSTAQAPHLNVAVFARGMLKQLFTRVYFAGDASNANIEDPVLNLVPESRRATLLAQPVPSRPNHWRFDVHLQGEQETVFFDV